MGEPVPDADIQIAWATDPATVRDAALFLARAVRTDTAYISHGEIQQGLSPDGKSWAPDLEQRFLNAAADYDDARSVLVARDGGVLVGAAIVHWDLDGAARFATLEDIAVAPQRRSAGVGDAMFREIERETTRRGGAWIFLESGLQNARAHAFFDRAGFQVVSKMFAKRLDQ